MLTNDEFSQLITNYQGEFTGYLNRILNDRSKIEDVLSDAILSAYAGLSKFEKGTNFRAWMYRIILNKVFVANRETKRMMVNSELVEKIEPSLYDTDIYNNPESVVDKCDDEVALALNQLNKQQLKCLIMQTVESYSYQEIAKKLDMPLGTVMTNISRARSKMRRILGDYALSRGLCAGAHRYFAVA